MIDSDSTPLRAAVRKGNKKLIEDLLLNGANVNEATQGGTVLQDAARYQNIRAMEVLTSYGADISAECGGITPLHEASASCYGTHLEIKTVKLLISMGADIHAIDRKGWTPLHMAANFGRAEAIETLIAEGADIHAKDKSGLTPIALFYDEYLSYAQTDRCRQLLGFRLFE